MKIISNFKIINKEFPLIIWVLVTLLVTGLFLLVAKAKFGIQNSGVFGDSFGFLTALFSDLAFAAAWHLIQLQKKKCRPLRLKWKTVENLIFLS